MTPKVNMINISICIYIYIYLYIHVHIYIQIYNHTKEWRETNESKGEYIYI
jgi:hypothetical protein